MVKKFLERLYLESSVPVSGFSIADSDADSLYVKLVRLGGKMNMRSGIWEIPEDKVSLALSLSPKLRSPKTKSQAEPSGTVNVSGFSIADSDADSLYVKMVRLGGKFNMRTGIWEVPAKSVDAVLSLSPKFRIFGKRAAPDKPVSQPKPETPKEPEPKAKPSEEPKSEVPKEKEPEPKAKPSEEPKSEVPRVEDGDIIISGPGIKLLSRTWHMMGGRGAPMEKNDFGFGKGHYDYYRAAASHGEEIPLRAVKRMMDVLGHYRNTQLSDVWERLSALVRADIQEAFSKSGKELKDHGDKVYVYNGEPRKYGKIKTHIPGLDLSMTKRINKVLDEYFTSKRLPMDTDNYGNFNYSKQRWRHFQKDDSLPDVYWVHPAVLPAVLNLLKSSGQEVALQDDAHFDENPGRPKLKVLGMENTSYGRKLVVSYDLDFSTNNKLRQELIGGRLWPTQIGFIGKGKDGAAHYSLAPQPQSLERVVNVLRKYLDVDDLERHVKTMEGKPEEATPLAHFQFFDKPDSSLGIKVPYLEAKFRKIAKHIISYTFPGAAFDMDSKTWTVQGDFQQYMLFKRLLERYEWDTSQLKSIIEHKLSSGSLKRESVEGEVTPGFESRLEKDLPASDFSLNHAQKEGVSFLSHRRSAILGDETGAGKCHAADTRVQTSCGSFRIEDIWEDFAGKIACDGQGGEWGYSEHDIIVHSVDEQGKVVPGKVEALYRERVKTRLRRVTTSNGKSITSTCSHKFLTPKGWRSAEGLQEGDYVCSSSNQPNYLPNLFRDFKLADSLGRDASLSSIPFFIMGAGDDVVVAFLKAFMERVPESIENSIMISPPNREMGYQLSLLLQRFGIMCVFVDDKIRVFGSGLEKHMERRLGVEPNLIKEGKPVGPILRAFFDKYPISTYMLEAEPELALGDEIDDIIVAFMDLKLGKTSIKYKMGGGKDLKVVNILSSILPEDIDATVAELVSLRNNDLNYETVVTIEDVDYDGYVYDLSVGAYRNYIAENLICHNTVQLVSAAEMKMMESGYKGDTLIVVPKQGGTTIRQWEETVLRVIGKDKASLISLNPLEPRRWTIVWYEMFSIPPKMKDPESDKKMREKERLLIDSLSNHRFMIVIMDELHKVKNPEATKTRNLLRVTENIPIKWGASATISSNMPIDVRNQLVMIGHHLGRISEGKFKREFAGMAATGYGGAYQAGPMEEQIAAAENLNKWLHLTGVYIRRRKEDIRNMPGISVKRQDAAYDKNDYYQRMESHVNRLKDPDQVISIINAAREEMAISKVPATTERVKEFVKSGKKVVVFTTFIKASEALKHSLREAVKSINPDWDILTYTSDTSKADLRSAKERFTDDPRYRVILMSMKMGGTGIDFPNAAQNMVINDYDWTPEQAEQSEGRIYRINTEKPVDIEYMIAPGTLDEALFNKVQQKRELAGIIHKYRKDYQEDREPEVALEKIIKYRKELEHLNEEIRRLRIEAAKMFNSSAH